jgi:hypothetical protein
MSSGGCAWIRYRDATGLKPPGERDEDSGQSEVLVPPQFGHGLDAEDLGKHVVVAFRETRERRRRSVENPEKSCLRRPGPAHCPSRQMLP